MGKCQGDCGIPQPSLQSEDMPQKPLDVSTLLFYPRAEEQQASLPGEQPRDANAARIHKSVRVCSHMVHHKQPHNLFCVAVFNSCRNIWGTIIMAADMADSQRSSLFFKRNSTNLRVREIVA